MASMTATKAFKIYLNISTSIRLSRYDREQLNEFRRLLRGEVDSVCIYDCDPSDAVTLESVIDVLEMRGDEVAKKFVMLQPGWKHAGTRERLAKRTVNKSWKPVYD